MFNNFKIIRTVTILILIDGFLQYKVIKMNNKKEEVTILILIDGFLQCKNTDTLFIRIGVTILILIDGFLQLNYLLV